MLKGYCIKDKLIQENQWTDEMFSMSKLSKSVDILNFVKNEHDPNTIELDAEQLISEWFPHECESNVFISHSHGDIKVIENFAGYLQKHQLTPFIDAAVWGSCENLIYEIDRKYNLLPNKEHIYGYEKDHVISSNVYLMLIRALNKMIRSCKAFVFVESDASIKDGRTFSPWIMNELEMQSALQQKIEVRKSVYDENLQFSYNIESALEGLEPIETIDELNQMIQFVK